MITQTKKIKASSTRRRQRVLDYISKIGEKALQFLSSRKHKGTSEDIGWDIPDNTIAVLVPEDLELFALTIPNSVKYIA